MTDIDEAERRIAATVGSWPEATRRELLRVLMATPAERAAAIGKLHRETEDGAAAELLIDLEQDRALALIIADLLKRSA